MWLRRFNMCKVNHCPWCLPGLSLSHNPQVSPLSSARSSHLPNPSKVVGTLVKIDRFAANVTWQNQQFGKQNVSMNYHFEEALQLHRQWFFCSRIGCEVVTTLRYGRVGSVPIILSTWRWDTYALGSESCHKVRTRRVDMDLEIRSHKKPAIRLQSIRC